MKLTRIGVDVVKHVLRVMGRSAWPTRLASKSGGMGPRFVTSKKLSGPKARTN
jgi:hypothetical protein